MTDFELTSNSQSNLAIPTNFKSTLPPRKRAKTKEEKEQRRIERILRNRRAAHQSREKKRLHLQYLERKCSLLENLLNSVNLEKLADHKDVLTCSHDAFVASLDEYRDFQSTRGASLDTRASSHSSSDTFTPSPLNCTMEPATLSPKSMRDSASDQETSWELQMFKTENVPESTTLPAVDNNNLFDAVASPLADPLCDDIAGNSLPFDNSIDLDNWRNPAVITMTRKLQWTRTLAPAFAFCFFSFFFFFFSRGSLMGEEPVKVPSKAECRVIGSFLFFFYASFSWTNRAILFLLLRNGRLACTVRSAVRFEFIWIERFLHHFMKTIARGYNFIFSLLSLLVGFFFSYISFSLSGFYCSVSG